ncbi:MAG TPA: hypothetical protein VF404_00365, partial [Sphingomonas sp.]
MEKRRAIEQQAIEPRATRTDPFESIIAHILVALVLSHARLLTIEHIVVAGQTLLIDRLISSRAMPKEAGAAMMFRAQKMDGGELQPIRRIDVRHALLRLELAWRRRHQRKISPRPGG